MRRRLASPYDADGNLLKNWDLGALSGAGGIRSTADDMLNYVSTQIGLTKTDLSPAIELTHKRQREFDKGNDIGLGWMIMKPDGFYLHGGQTGGYHTSVEFDCSKRVGVVVLSTTTSGLPDVVGIRLMRRMLGQKVEPPSPRQTVTVEPKVLERYVGEYKLGLLSWITIQKAGDHLTARLTGQPACRIYAESETKFFWKIVDAQLTFDVDASGKVTGLVLHQNGQHLPAEKTK
jgi:CubicO group peptidase (beta-lactamase class C family)